MNAKELVLKSVGDWNKKDKMAFLSYFTESSEITGPGGVVLRGLEGLEMFWDVWQGALPDNKSTISNLFGDGDTACGEGTFEGTHTGTLRLADGGQIPATGRQMCLRFAQVFTTYDDKFVTSQLYFDQFELFTQLGLMPIR